MPSDGTGTGTVLVKDFFNFGNPYGPSIFWMGDLNGTLLATVFDGATVDLWTSDGTTSGTVVVKDSTGNDVEGLSPFTVIGNTAFFEGEDATTPDFELFRTDGTSAGTYWISAGNMSHPNDLTNVNGILFFSGYDPTHGDELWKSDGTAAGTVLVKDIDAGSGGSYPRYLTNVNGTLYFVASDGTSSGSGLWKSDGTDAGTVLVQGGISASNLTNVNGTLFFAGNDGKSGWELWDSDGTAKGTKMVKDIYPGTTTYKGNFRYHYHSKRPNSSFPSYLTNVNGTLFFSASDGKNGRELWKSDGTSKGTVQVSDINPGSGGSYPGDLTIVNGTLFFSTVVPGSELWKSDGTAAGTVLVKDINPIGSPSYIGNLTNANGTLYFSANDGTNGNELWISDGTTAGTMLVKDINPGSGSSNPRELTVSGGHLFFVAADPVDGDQLWDPPIMPAAGANALQAPQGSAGDSPPVSGLPEDRDAGLALLITPWVPLRPVVQNDAPPHADDLIGTVLAPNAGPGRAEILDQVFAGASAQFVDHFGSSLDQAWTDLLEEFALGGSL